MKVPRTALITGGSRGIGFAIAEKFCKNGIQSILLSRDENKLKQRVRCLEEMDPSLSHSYIAHDLSADMGNLEPLIKGLFDKKQGKSIDILVNCAGVTQNSLLPFTSVSKIEEIVNVNLLSPMVLSKLVSRNLLSMKRPGHIVNISSVLAEAKYDPIRGTSVYSATKSALVSFTRKLDAELNAKGIYANVVLPSLIRDTEIGESVDLEEYTRRGIDISVTDTENVSDKVCEIVSGHFNGQIIYI